MPERKTIYKTSVKFSVVVGLFFILLAFVLIISGNNVAGASEPGALQNSTTTSAEQADAQVTEKINGSFTDKGKASYYADDFHGRRTASGQTFDMNGFTAAHKSLPFGSVLRVTNPVNNASVLVMVNDRGPFVRSRVLDMARGAARSIDVTLHTVAIDGFQPKDFRATEETYIGFTAPSYEAYKLPASRINVLDTVASFSDAVREHRLLATKQPNQELYLIVAPAKDMTAGKPESGYKYFIATMRNPNDNFDTAQLLNSIE